MFVMVNILIAAALYSVQFFLGRSDGESIFIVPDFDMRMKATASKPDQPKAS